MLLISSIYNYLTLLIFIKYEVLDDAVAAEGGVKDVNWMKMMIRPAFWMIYIGEVAFGILSSGLYTNFIGMATDLLGISDAKAAWLYSLFTVVVGAAGIVIGFISDKLFGAVKTLSFTCLVGGAAIALFLATGANSLALYVVLLVMAGIGLGAIQSLTPVIMMGAWGNKYFGINYGIMLTTLTVSSFIGPQIAVRYPVTTFLSVSLIAMLVAAVLIFFSAMAVNKEVGKKIF